MSGFEASGARRALAPLIGLALSAAFLWLALRGADLRELSDVLAGAARWPLAPCALALAAFFWLKAERWRLLLRAEHAVRTARLIDPMMMGFAANNVLPLRAGELIRVYVAGRSLGIPKVQVFASLVVERVLDALAVAALVGVALSLVWSTAAPQRWLLGATAAAMLASGGALAVLHRTVGGDLPALARHLARYLERLPSRLRGPARNLARELRAGLEPVVRERLLLATLASSLAQWALLSLCVYLSVLAVGIEARSIPMAMIVLGVVVLGISVPSGPAYVGNVEYAFVLGLGFFGVAPEAALAAAIYYHGFTFVGVTTAGAACWARHALGARARRRGADIDADAGDGPRGAPDR